jgi:hypothetical protein
MRFPLWRGSLVSQQPLEALFIGRGVITSKGIVPPKDGIKGELYGAFMDELEKRAIRVLERVEVLD